MEQDENSEFISEGGSIEDGEHQDLIPKVTDNEALDALQILFRHCNQTDAGTPETNSALAKYLDRVIAQSFKNKQQSDIRTYFTKQ